MTSAYYDIEIDHASQLPVTVKMVLLAATKGETEVDKATKKIVGGKHVAFWFNYKFSDFGKITKPDVPREAQRILARG